MSLATWGATMFTAMPMPVIIGASGNNNGVIAPTMVVIGAKAVAIEPIN